MMSHQSHLSLLMVPNLFVTTLILFVIVVVRYFALAGLAYWLCWVKFNKKLGARRIQAARPDRKWVRREILWSLLSSVIFALSGTAGLYAWERGWTLVYLEIPTYGWFYFFASILLLAFLHDTYFYWTHRLMHLPGFFKWFHQIHHDSKNPTPWAAFSFHPLEACVEAIILPVFVFILPLHPAALLVFLTAMTVFGIINHLGYELYPLNFSRHWLWRWVISATHHDQHHRLYKNNLGLYFTWWDHWMGTEHQGYPDAFDKYSSQKV